ncbi:MAG: methyltransferase domain-containing protein [Myxococcales bacterium]|nr:methyltransferase domain-containing protein [Myxococcales bacterium]
MNPAVLQQSYDRFAARYDAAFIGQQRPKIVALASRLPDESPAVDLGCGTCLARRITGRAFIGLDRSRGMLGQGRGPRVQADLSRLPFADGSIAVALCVTALIDFLDPAPVARELARVLRPGGALAVSVLKHEDVDGLLRALDDAGLEVVERLDLAQDFGFVARRRQGGGGAKPADAGAADGGT